MLIHSDAPDDDGLLGCRLCGAELNAINCFWRAFPGICKDCAPNGLFHKASKPHRTKRTGMPLPPLGFIHHHRMCGCGAARLRKRRRLCDDCREDARRATYELANARRH